MQVTIKGAIYAVKYDWSESLFYYFKDYEPEGSNYVKVCDHEIITEIPDKFDPRPGMVENLEREKKDLQAKFGKRIAEINAQIQSLLAIEA